jgi:hypothetical protein
VYSSSTKNKNCRKFKKRKRQQLLSEGRLLIPLFHQSFGRIGLLIYASKKRDTNGFFTKFAIKIKTEMSNIKLQKI